jgi:hypothetical protein
VTVKRRSPTVIAPVRLVTSLFLSTPYANVPFPVPGLPDVTWSHEVLLVADHWQCSAAVTAKVPVALSLPNDALVGEI